VRKVVRVEPELGRDGERKLRTFTIVWRLGTVGNRIEKHVSEILNASLTTANREHGGNQIQYWRAKTRAEKRKRALAKQGETPGRKAAASGRGKAGGKAGGGRTWQQGWQILGCVGTAVCTLEKDVGETVMMTGCAFSDELAKQRPRAYGKTSVVHT